MLSDEQASKIVDSIILMDRADARELVDDVQGLLQAYCDHNCVEYSNQYKQAAHTPRCKGFQQRYGFIAILHLPEVKKA